MKKLLPGDFFWSSLGAFIICIGCGYYLYRIVLMTHNGQIAQVAQIETSPTPKPTGSPQASAVKSKPSPTASPVAPIVKLLDKPQKIESIGLLAKADESAPLNFTYCTSDTDCSAKLDFKYEPNTTYYQLGILTYKDLKTDLYGAVSENLPRHSREKTTPRESDISYDGVTITLFIRQGNDTYTIFTPRVSNLNYSTFVSSKSAIENVTYEDLDLIPNHDFTDTVSGINFFGRTNPRFFEQTGLYKIATLDNNLELYTNQAFRLEVINLSSLLKPSFFTKNVVGMSGDVLQNSLFKTRFEFKKSEKESNQKRAVENISWSEEEKPQNLLHEPIDEYKSPHVLYDAISYQVQYQSCTASDYTTLIRPDEYIDVKTDIKKVGTTASENEVYELGSNRFDIYRTFWNSKVAEAYPDMSYDQYLKLKPILVLKDKRGMFYLLFREDLVNSKCSIEL